MHESIKKICNSVAIRVASRKANYRRPDGAIRALRRECNWLTVEEARHAIDIGELVIKEAIKIICPKNLIELEKYRKRKPNGPTEKARIKYEAQLLRKFPECTVDGVRTAINYAVFYSII